MSNVEPKKNNEQKRLIIIAAILLIISAVIFAVANNWNIMGLRTAKNNGIGADTNVRVNVNKQATPKIVGGYNYFVALTAEGKVYGWGDNSKGQLATGDAVNQKSPVYMGIDNAIDIAAGSYFTLVLKDDGTVWAVGNNTNGELGNGTKENSLTFEQVKTETGYLDNIKAVAAGNTFAFAITNDNEVYAWGYNNYGQLGLGDGTLRTVATKTPLTGITQISAGANHTIALDENGAVWVVGYNNYGQLGLGNRTNISTPQKILESGAKEVATGEKHTAVLKTDGTVWVTGFNGNSIQDTSYYILGLGGSGTNYRDTYFSSGGTNQIIYKLRQMKVGNSTTVISDGEHITANGNVTYVTSQSGGMYTVGVNTYGTLFRGNATMNYYSTKVQTSKTIKNIAVTRSGNTGAYVDNIGRIYTVGYSEQGQLGNATTATSYGYIAYDISDYKLLATPSRITMQKGTTQNIKVEFSAGLNLMDADFDISMDFASLDETVATVNGSTITAVGEGTTYIRISDTKNGIYGAVKVDVTEEGNVAFAKIVGGNNYFVSLKSDGTVWTWGANNVGQLGLGDNVNKLETTKTDLSDVVDIAAGTNFTAVLKSDGTVWTTGSNSYGQLGDATAGSRNTFDKVEGLTDVIALTAENYTIHALKSDGTVWSWGLNSNGQFGNQTTTNSQTPVKATKIPNIMQMSGGANHLIMQGADGSVWAVGNNTYGQLGLGNRTRQTIPQKMLENGVKEVAAGANHTMVLKTDGTVWGTGYQGDNSNKNTYFIIPLGGSTASYRDDTFSDNGNSVSYVHKLRQIKGDNASTNITNGKHITASGNVTYVTTQNSGMYTMGTNSYGALFSGNTSTNYYATKVQTDKEILAMAVTRNHLTGAIADQDGMVYTVGYNANGELGNGTTENLVSKICISNEKINVRKNIIDFQNPEEKERIEYTTELRFNLLHNEIQGIDCTYTSLDEGVAKVNEDGIVTAVATGTTYIQLYNERNDIYAKVKINVNGNGNISQPKIVGGYNHFVALKGDGTVWTWGLNEYGQLGLGDSENRTEPIKTNMKNVIDIAAGSNFTAVLRTDGTVWMTGHNNYGQLGDGTKANSEMFHKVKLNDDGDYLENIIQITAENQTMHALTAGGEVYSWGLNSNGQFGNQTTTNSSYPVKMLKISEVSQISGGANHLVMVLADNSVWVVGDNNYGQLGLGNRTDKNLPQRMLENGAKEVAAGANHTMVLKTDGTVWGTGYQGDSKSKNVYLIIPLGGSTASYRDDTFSDNGNSVSYVHKLRQIKGDSTNTYITNGKHITASGNVTYVTTQNSGMYTMGTNSYGTLFSGNTSVNYYATKVQTDKEILAMAVTRSYSTGAIADQDGMVYTVGYNANGELGNGTTENLTVNICISNKKINVDKNIINFEKAGDTEKIEYTTGMTFNLLQDTIPRAECTYTSLDNDIATVSEDGLVTAVATGTTCIQLYNEENNMYASVKVNVNGEKNITQPKIVGGGSYFVALKGDGSVYTWGINTYGQLGTGDNVRKTEPTKAKYAKTEADGTIVEEDLTDVIDVAAGLNHTLVIKKDGTVWASGYNEYGQLGNGTKDNSNLFVQVKGANGVGYLKNVVQITAGNNTSHVLTADGQVWSWGLNSNGQFGNATTTSSNYPVEMQKVSNVIQISGGANHLVMVLADSSVWAVGNNKYGQLGLENRTSQKLPQRMLASGAKEVAAGANHTMVLKTDGTVWGTGYQGDYSSKNTYFIIPLGGGTAAYRDDTFSDNGNTVSYVHKLRQIKGDNASTNITNGKHITASGNVTYVTTQNSGMYTMGTNSYGALFSGNTSTNYYATKVQTDKEILAMAVTRNHLTGAIADQDGMVYTVGYNANGELGNGTTENLTVNVCISNKKINVDKNIINFEQAGDTEKITYGTSVGFNLLQDIVPGEIKCTYTSLDEDVATVSEDGLVTAVAAGTTYIQLYNAENDMYASVKVNVNGKENIAQPKIVGGSSHFVGLKGDGSVYTWGINTYGQLGTGDNVRKTEPTKAKYAKVEGNGTIIEEDLTDVIDVAAGANYTLALKTDGTVWAAGYNGYGQLGDGTKDNSNVFVQVKDTEEYLKNVIQITAEDNTSHALTANGQVYSWGLNSNGQFGNATTANSSYPVQMQKVSNVIQISGGANHLVMVLADSSVWVVGDNNYGQLGLGNRTDKNLPQRMLENGAKEVAAGANHTMVLKTDGTVWGTGYQGDSRSKNVYLIIPLGGSTAGYRDDTFSDNGNSVSYVHKLRQIKGDDANTYITNGKHITAGGNTTYVSTQDAGMYTMGMNKNGVLFRGNTSTNYYATKVQKDKEILTMAVTRSYSTGAIADKDGLVYTVGYNANGEVGDGTIASTTTPVCISNLLLKVTPNVINYTKVGDTGEKITHSVSAGFNLLYNTVAQGNCKYTSLDESIATVSEDGIVTATGLGTTYIRVFNEEHSIWTSVKVNVNGEQGKTQAKIVGGYNHFVALKANGELWTWGYNNYGQLGLANLATTKTPTKTSLYDSKDEAQDVYVADVAAGAYHTLALKSDGTVWAAGYNAYGQLGNGSTANSTEFVQVQGIPGKVVAIAANNSSSYALTENGMVYGWGYNKYGQLGNNSTANSTVPVKVQRVTGVMKMSAGENHLIILASDGTVWSTGYNANGQLGDGTKTNKAVPAQMKNAAGTGVLTGIVDVSAGSMHTLLLSKDGYAYAVGYNGYGQLGNGNKTAQALPVQMVDSKGTAVTDIKDVEANGYVSILSAKETANEETDKTDAGIYVAGYNNYGQLFTGNKTNLSVLTKVQADKNVITMASTKNISYQTSAIVDDLGIVYTVGYNGHAEMGDGTTTSTLDPTSISNESITVNNRRVILNLESNTTDKIEANTNLGFNLLFDNVDGEVVKYVSQDESIASVDDSGNIVAKSYGKTKIEVTTSSITEKVLIDVEVIGKDDVATPKVVRGQEFSVALKADGTVWTWGYNGYGQLGLKDTSIRYKPTQVSIENVIDIAAGANHVLLLTKDGKVYTFGQNSYSQLGRSGDVTRPEIVEGLENITKIAAGAYHSMALANDGSVYTWGYNGNGQLGNGTTTSSSTPIKVKAKNIYQIDAGNQTSAAVDGNGNTYIWGYNGYGQIGNGTKTNLYAPRQVTSLKDIVEVAVQNNTVLVLNAAGNVFASGYNAYGNLGNNTTQNSSHFVQVIEKYETTSDGEAPIYLSNIKSIEAGSNYTIAVKEDGTAVSWGQNSSSQMATGDTANKLLPVELTYGKGLDKIDGILDVAAGEATTTIVREDGKVWTVGKNNYGQLGDTSATNKTAFVCISKPTVMIENVPIRINGIGKTEQVKSNVSQGFNLLYNTVDNTEISYEIKDENIATIDKQTGEITSVKKGKTQVTVKDGISGESTTADVYVLDENDLTFPQIESSNYATLTLRANGEVWGYGYNGYGQLGTGDKANKTVPTYTGINNIVQIALGYYHAIAVDKDGYVWTWGTNNYGQLGIGTTGGNSLEKVQVKSPDGEGVLENIIAVAAGNSYSVALDKDGNVYTWGYNGYGGLGLGDKNTRNLPVKVESLQAIKKIEAGANSTFAIDGNGKLYAAGYNNYGQLGDGTTSTRTSFVEVKLLDNVADVSTSYTSSTIVLKQDGTVWGFGNNKYNALTNVSGSTPRQLQGPNGVLNNVTSINAGYYSGYAITSEEKILAWGLNNYYQLATGNNVNQSVPVYMKDKDGNDFTDAMLVSGGISNTEVAKNDGTVWSIGYNRYGALGDGTTATKANLVSISNKYVKLAEKEITLKLSNPDYQINPESVYGFNLLYDSIENKGFTYKVENPGVATVDENTGKVTAKEVGRTYVTVSSKDSEDEARLVVNVIAEDKKTVEKVESGHIHSLALKQDGTIWSWGDNSQGEMGNGTISSIRTLEPTQIEKGKYIEVREEETEEGSTQITTTEIEVTLDNIVDIAAGKNFNLVLDSDGYVYSFGYNGYGQLGDGTKQAVSVPTRIEGLSNIKKVYAYENTSMAIDEAGDIYVWGEDYEKTPTKINFYNNKAVEINGKLILSEDGGVWYLSNSPSKIAGLSNIVDIASGDNYYAALDTKGQVWVWGYNGYGQLSQANRTNVSTPALVKVAKEAQEGTKVEYETLTDIVELNAGNNSLQMVSKSGTLYAAGYSARGQLGTGTYNSYVTIATKAVGMNQTKFVDSNSYHSIASDIEGFVYTTGYNAYGELGDGGYTNRNTYKVIGDTYVNVGDNSIQVEEGDTKEITATLDNKFNLITDTVDDGNMTYKSLNTDIAIVDGNGKITAKQMGTVEIVVTHTITNKTATIFVQVVPKEKVTVPKVEIGNTHMAALKADGTVWTWGANGYGQLGTENNVSKTSPIKVPSLEDVRDISVGYYDTLVVKQDGTVWAFGYNRYGQLGDGTATNRNTPTQVIKSDGAPLTKIVKVSAGTYRTVALDEDGNVWTWGYKYSKSATKIAGLEDIIDISLNYAIDKSGKVYKITEPDTKLEINDEIIRVSEGSNHTMFLTKGGNAYALGTNSKGQLGIGTTTNATVPTLVQNSDGTQALDNIKEIKAGNEFSIAILKNGETYTWGDNANYKLGLADADYQVYPRKNEQTNPAISGDAGINNGAIIDEEGFVYTWGLGDNGILGNNLYETSIQPVLVGKEEVGLSENDIVLHKGEEYQLTVTNKTFNVLKEVEDKGEMNYQIGNSDIATIDDTGLVTGAKEGKTTVVVNKVGTNSISIANITVLPDGIDIEPMALTNMSHTVVLKANGTVWSYGINSSYQLGNGNTVSSDRPVQVKFPAGVIIKQIAVGNTHNLALDTNGNVWGWGANSNNALAGYTRSTPVQLGLSGIKKIAASNNQSMALTNDGYVYVWGLNTNGELGIGTYEKVERPTLVNYVSNVLDISLGKNHSMLLTTHGEVLTTGLNAYGQTAASESKTNTFEKIEVPATIGKMSAGDNHSVLLSANGDVYTFGYNANGQLGNGTINNVNIPTKVNISNIMQISAGATHTTLLGENRKIYTTGSNSNGELGIGTNEDKLIFNEITAVEDMLSVDAGNTYNVAIKYDGDVYGWGDYYHGTQNIKTKTNSRIPVKIGNDSTYMEETEITVNVNGTKQIAISPRYTFNVFNEDEEESEFTFETINEDIATVNEKGIVTGVKTGVTWVKVTENETMQQNVVIVKVIEQGVKYAPQIAGGDGYAAVLKGDGSIWSFGYNSDGQLGNDTLAPINIPSQTNILATYKQVVAGEKFTLALRDDGTVWAWGDNSYGMLGQGNRVSAKKPVQVQVLNNIVSIAAGDNHAIALDNQGNVYTWGLNSKGQLGNGNTQTVSIPEKINAVENQIVAVAAGGDLSAFVDSTGAVYVFGDNSQEQIQKLTYNRDEFGQIILPATNLYVTEATKLETIEDAAKVDILETGLVVLKTDGGVIKTSKYAAEADVQTTTIATENMVDISATNDSVVLLDRNGNTYTYGDNSKGQAGIGSNGGNVELSKIDIADEKTYLSVGAGYKNNYVIDTEGFVYAAGDNEYGQLGNGTYDNSYTFTLVGDKKFEIVPSARIMQQPEEETVTIKTNLFNVFNHTERKLIDYTWESSNSDVVSVDNGVLVAEDMGEATITATDKVTGEKATALRVVQPLDEQRIQTISVNGVEAEVSGENKYEVSVEKNPGGTGTLKIVTKDATDQISIDNGVSYVTASLTQDIDLDTNPKVVKIKVKASNGRTVDYVLTINVLSNDASLKELTVNNVLATPITSTEYEIIVKNNVVKPEVHAVANSSSATISIDSSIAEKSQTTKTIDMQNVIKKTIPIQVTAENGDKVTYELTIYQEDALTELESVMVNGSEAIKLNNNNYKAVIPKDEISAEIVAKSLYPKANIEINGLGQEVNITTKTVATIGNETIVKIYVRAGEGEAEREREYTLTLVKEGTEDLQGLFAVTVNGVEIKPVGKIYDAYIGQNTDSVEVTAVTISDKDLVQIGDNEKCVHTSTVTLDIIQDINTYIITVTDPEDETIQKQYTLNINKPSADNSLKSVTIGNEEFSETAVRVEGTNTFKVSVSDKYTKADVIAVAGYEQAQVSINYEEYEKGLSTREVEIGDTEPTKVEIMVKALNGNEQTYTLEIYKKNSNNNLQKVLVDGEEAQISQIAENIYEYTLDKIVDKLTIGAIAEDSSAFVGINTYEQEKGATYREVEMIGKQIIVYIPVTAEDGTTKEYQLIVNALPDNVNLLSVKVNGKEANAVPINKYEARVNKNDQSFELYVIPEDSKAKIQIGTNQEVVGTSSAVITKDAEEVTVNIKVTAQDGTQEDYVLTVSNQSDDCELAILRVDNKIIRAEDDGKYYVDKKYLTEEIKVQAIANNNYATVSINGTTPTLEEQTSIVTMPDEENTVRIMITAEDGTQKEYILIVNKLSNEVGISAYVGISENGVIEYKEVEINENGQTIIKIGNQELTNVKVIAKDELAKVSIQSELPQEKEMEKEIATIEDETKVNIQVTAQDGTIGNYEITLTRASKNNNLLELKADGVDSSDILKTSDNEYLMKIPDTIDELNLTAIAENEYATVKIADGEYSTDSNSKTEKITVNEEITEIAVYVKAENGDEKEYKVTIQKVTDLGLDSVKVDGEECIKEDGNYVAFINRGTQELALNIKPNNQIALLSTKLQDDEDFGEAVAQETHIRQVNISSDETTVLIRVQDPKDLSRTREYTVVIKRKSSDASLEMIQIDGKEPIITEDGYYMATSTNAIDSKVFVKATNKYANIKIADEDEEQGQSTKSITLSDGKLTTFVVTITSQDGTSQNTFNVTIERKSQDTSCEILINNEKADEIDNETNTYTKYVNRDLEEATIMVTTTSDVATVEMAGESATQTLTKVISIASETTTMEVIVTAESGETKTYHVNIVKKSTDNTIATVKVDNKIVEPDEEGNYVATVYDKGLDVQDVLVEVVANESHAKVQIGDGTEWSIGERTSTVSFKNGNRTMTLNINVQSQDETTEKSTKTLTINLVSNDVTIKSVKNGDQIVTEYDQATHTYYEFLDREVEQLTLVIEANNNYTTLTSGEMEGTGIITLNNVSIQDAEEMTITFKAIAETGNEQEYTIKLLRKSDNANAAHIYVDGVDIIDSFEDVESVPTAIVSISKNKNNSQIKVIPENSYASIKIGDFGSKVGETQNTVSLDTDLGTITVPIVITSQDGKVVKTYNIMFVRLSNDTKIQWLEVNGKHVIENDEGNYEITVKASEEVANVKITLSNILAKVTMGGEEKQGHLEENVILQKTGDMVKTITVTAVDGTVKTHTLTIHKKVNDLGLDKIYLDNRLATKVDETTFEIDVEKGMTLADIRAVASNSEEYVSISGNTSTKAENIYTDCSVIDKVVKIKVSAMFDGELDEEKEYTLILKEIEESDVLEDLNVIIKVDDEEIIPDANGNYVKFVGNDKDNVALWAGVTSETSKVKITDRNGETQYENPSSQKNISLQDMITEVTVTVQNGALQEKEYTVKIQKLSAITGKVITQATDQENQTAEITIYNSADTRDENDIDDPREEIQKIMINPDGTYRFDLQPGEYDMVIRKTSYLEYRLTNIVIGDGETAKIADISIYAGDVVETGEIEIDDLVAIADNYGLADEQEENKDRQKYDLNEDGIVDKLDRDILKANYGKLNEVVQWVNPNAIAKARIMTIEEPKEEQTQDFILPIKCDYTITSEYGTRTHPITGETKKHTGIDLGVEHHTEVLTVAEGEITFAGVQNGFGNCIEIKHIVNGETIYSFYAHLSRIDVKTGEKVAQGQVIGLEGGDPNTDPNPGSSTGHHLHFEMRNASGYGNDVDPREYIEF